MTYEELRQILAQKHMRKIEDPYPELTQIDRDNAFIDHLNQHRGLFQANIPRKYSVYSVSPHAAYQQGWEAAWKIIQEAAERQVK